MSMFNDKSLKSVAESVRKILEASAKKADKDYDKDGKIESPKDEVWGSRLRAAKMAGKLKEEEELDEGKWPDFEAERKKREAPKPSGGSGMKQGSRYGGGKQAPDNDNDADDMPKKKGKKKLSEMRKQYAEEVDNETFTKEMQDQKAKFDGKKKGGDVAKPSVQAVKNEEVEQMDEVAPPGREDQVKALKKVPGIDNPYAVSWASYRKSHPKKSKE